jgi:hypothetical protein
MNEHELGDFPGGVDRKWGAINTPTTVTVDLPPTEERMKCRRCRWVGPLSERRRKPSASCKGMTDLVCPRCACKTFTKEEQPRG